MAALRAEGRLRQRGRFAEGGLRPTGRTGSRSPGEVGPFSRRPALQPMRTPIAGSLGLLAVCASLLAAPAQPDTRLQAQLRQLFPQAASFTPKGGEPPHFKALDAQRAVAGYAFWTTELEPLERGYDGPIKILVGLNPRGVLTGIVVAEHNEPYGNFSIDLPKFPQQFRGKNLRDPFRVGGDIHAVSRATMTVTSAARAVRNSARRIARQLLTPPGSSSSASR
jgi:transcriptional regulator of nitric oxide reductase